MGVIAVGELPRVAKGVTFEKTPPRVAPMNLVNFLNDVSLVLNVRYKREADLQTAVPGFEKLEGVNVSVIATWLGERSWKVEFSVTNSIARPAGDEMFPEGLPDGGMISGLEEFTAAIGQTNTFLDAYNPKYEDDKPVAWDLLGGLGTHFEGISWNVKPGAAGDDGVVRGASIELLCTTKPNVGLDKNGVGYWAA